MLLPPTSKGVYSRHLELSLPVQDSSWLHMASEPSDSAASKVEASDTAENHANASVEKAPDDGSKLKTLLGLLRKYD